MGNTIGSRIVLEGEREYREALKNINAEQKELRSEMSLASAEFSAQQNSLEALTKKHEILSQQIESQQEKVSIYKGALEEANAAHEQAGKTVEDYKAQLTEAQKELEEMKKSSDTSKEAIEEQNKKIEEISGALEKAENSYQKSENTVLKWQTSLNYAQTDLKNLEGELKQTEQYMEEADSSVTKCASSIDEYGKKAKEAGENTNEATISLKDLVASDMILTGLEKLAGLIKLAGEELIQMGIGAAAQADNICTLSTVTGIATETIQELYYAEELMDVSVNTVTSSMAKNIRAMNNAAEGSASYAEAYKKLGVEVTNTDGSLRDSETVFWECIDSMKAMHNETERDAVAMTIFGRSAQSLNPLIKAGSSGFQEFAKEAKQVGYVLDQDTLNGLNNTSDALERMSKITDAVKTRIGAEMAPAIEDAVESITEAVQDNEEELLELCENGIEILTAALKWIIENSDTILNFSLALGSSFIAYEVGSKSVALVTAAMTALSIAQGTATTAQIGLNTAMMANPIGLVVGAIAALTAGLVTLGITADDTTSDINRQAEALKDGVQEIENHSKATQDNISYTKNLKNEIVELNKKEVLSNSEKGKMAALVAELNDALPDLNLQIDEQTGKLEENTVALEENFDAALAVYELEANQEELTAILQEAAEARRAISELDAELYEKEQQLAEATQSCIEQTENYGTNVIVLQNEVDALNETREEETAILEGLETRYSDLSGKVAENQQIVEANSEAQAAAQEAQEAEEAAIEALQEAYATAKTAAEDSIKSQVGLFEELSIKSELSVEGMRTALDSQTSAYEQYADDLEACRGRAELANSGILESIEEMGLEGAGYVHELANASDEEIEQIMTSFQKMEEARDNLTTTMAEMELGVEATYDEMNSISESRCEEMLETQTTTMKDLTQTITDETPNMVLAIETMFDEVEIAATTKLNIVEGKSMTYKTVGESIPKGLAEGIRTGKSEFIQALEEAMDEMAEKAVAKAKEAARKIDRALGSALK